MPAIQDTVPPVTGKNRWKGIVMQRVVLRVVTGLAAGLTGALAAGAGDAASGGAAAPSPGPLAPREAGARHGQALGVALMCYGMRTTAALTRLPSAYTGADRAAFEAESAKVLIAWREASTCRAAGGPNACRLSYEWSCSSALREIGPRGTALPGLVEPKTP